MRRPLRKILLNIFLWFLLFILSTCKKYPEDPFISFKTVKMRLEGEWQLESIEINEEDVGFKYNDSLTPLTFQDYKFWFAFDAKIDNSNQKYNLFLINKSSKSEENAIKSLDVSGVEFSITPKKTKNLNIASASRITGNDTISSKILLNLHSDFFWHIKKLYNKQFIIERVKNNTKYRLRYKKIRNK